MLKLGSLFDGSGGFPLAGSLVGIEPVWAAEVEPYPIAVTRTRFPNMKHLGDISKINGAEIEPVDIITFGSPCQNLSVAGKRAGLKHKERGDEETTQSGLFVEAVRIIKEMREATNGRYPSIALWENVPGAFSSNKGEDFRTVCEELIKIVEPSAAMPEVPQKGWPYADCYIGEGWSLAYRVFDAQYWGVAQRRRRIHLILDLRGERARKILFEREGLRGDFKKSGTQGQSTSRDVEKSSGTDDNKVYTVDQGGGKSACNVQEELSPTLTCTHGGEPAVAYTLKIRSGCEGGGKGALIQEDKSATLATNNDQYLFQPVEPTFIIDNIGGQAEYGKESIVNGTLRAGGQGAVAYPEQYLFENHRADKNIAGTLVATDYKDPQLVAYGLDRASFNQGKNAKFDFSVLEEQQPTLTAKGPGATMDNNYIVRRLTPTECARLQGFPDRWGDIEAKTDFTDEEYAFWLEVRNTHAAVNGKQAKEYTKAQMLTWYNKLHTDSAEYKMWGNGIALPPALYCMEGIVEALTEDNNDN